MAPIPREFPSTPGVLRPSTELAREPSPGTKYISLRLILELLMGTVAIFIIGVLSWKLGRFIRSFTRERVLTQGNSPSTRYARTWYGWIPLQRHERNKGLVQQILQKLCGWTTWSSKPDYRWVWWDPGQKELQNHKANQKFHQWLPIFLWSRSFATADDIWNPRHSVLTTNGGAYVCSPDVSEGLVSPSAIFNREYVPSKPQTTTNWPQKTRYESRVCELKAPRTIRRGVGHLWEGSFARCGVFSTDDTLFWQDRRRNPCMSQSAHILRKRSYRSSATKNDLFTKSSSLPCLLTRRTILCGRAFTESSRHSNSLWTLRCSRKYQIWSARMQLKMPRVVRNGSLGPLAPPGSPISDLLASLSSHQTSLLELSTTMSRKVLSTASASSEMAVYRDTLRQSAAGSSFTREQTKEEVMAQSGFTPVSYSPELVHKSPSGLSCGTSVGENPSPLSKNTLTGDGKDRSKKQTRHIRKELSQAIIPIQILNDWEIRLIYTLSCRLEWLANQLSPGRRPFHFAMLPNHWLNKGTWVVYDPPCRTPIDARRKLGDSRFVTTYPMPEWTAKKFPKVDRKVAHYPRINSWRSAVNYRRKSIGLDKLVKTIELFESSGEEPPDGKVDPTCWMLRRPPQGVGLSRHQEGAYYEGGAGWQETLYDWQRVRRGYRIRKMIHHGRANRTRVKQVALSVFRPLRTRRTIRRIDSE